MPKSSSSKLPYDKTSARSIEAYAQLMKDKSLRKLVGAEALRSHKGKGVRAGKGGFGQLVEELYFKYSPNSTSGPDFPEAKLELKTTPIKETKKGKFVSKERLVLNMIDFMEEHKRTFDKSSFWKKNAHLLLLFYLYQADKKNLDYLFRIIKRWKFPEADLKIIRDDWKKIVGKIKAGKAHELSEGDTLYLGACPKGANKKSVTKQPFSTKQAMKRAFSFKSKYVNFIIDESGINKKYEAAVKKASSYKKGETFEDKVIARFSKYVGKSEKVIAKKLGIPVPKGKAAAYQLCKAVMGIKGKKDIEEFEKADIALKTIRFEETGSLKESMSFARIQYDEIVKEKWEDSFWHETLTKRFFFVVFQKKGKDLILKKVLFWAMPAKDLKVARAFWEDTKKKVNQSRFKDFIRISDDRICHVRPKAAKEADKVKFRRKKVKKLAYWLNSSYIKEVVTH